MRWAVAVLGLLFVPNLSVAAETSVFSQSLKDATRVMMTVANPHASSANEAFKAGDKITGCTEARLAYDGYTNGRQIFRTALQHYESAIDDPNRAEVIGYLKENIDAMTRMRLPYELFLTNVCPAITGFPAPVGS
jgi:hypothetical protein